jgi:hypothetical protein
MYNYLNRQTVLFLKENKKIDIYIINQSLNNFLKWKIIIFISMININKFTSLCLMKIILNY